MARTGPIVIGYDRTSASRPAIDETVALFARRNALVVVVWEAGRALELLVPPADIVALPPTTIEARAAFELDQATYPSAEQHKHEWAALAIAQDMKTPPGWRLPMRSRCPRPWSMSRSMSTPLRS